MNVTSTTPRSDPKNSEPIKNPYRGKEATFYSSRIKVYYCKDVEEVFTYMHIRAHHAFSTNAELQYLITFYSMSKGMVNNSLISSGKPLRR